MRDPRLRFVAVAFAGGTAFLDMYATQPLLPQLRAEFGASEAAVAATVSALTFAAAIAAPLAGPLADALGRKRVIVASIALLALVTAGASTAPTLHALVVWRFLQGLAMPGIFATTLAYIAEEFPPEVGGRAVGAYIGGNVAGGFLGRWIAAVTAAHAGRHEAFLVLAALNAAGGLVVVALLPPARRFVRRASPLRALGAMAGFLRDPRLLAVYAVGASVLFTLIAAFTFVTFHLAAPPFSLGTVAIGNVFAVYLAGVIATPVSGALIDRRGHRTTVLAAIGLSVCGMLLTLAPALWAVVAGLAAMSTGVFVAQAASQGYVGVLARANRGTAAALYLSCYYVGGGLGAAWPAAVWSRGGWPATVALIVAVQAAAALLAALGWQGRAPARPKSTAIPAAEGASASV